MVKYPSTQGQQSQGGGDTRSGAGYWCFILQHPQPVWETQSFIMDVNLPFFSIFMVTVKYDLKEKERKRTTKGER